MTCVDLAARFGARYRLGWEADGATRADWPRDEWPWLRRVNCRYGVVYPVGGEILAAWTNRRRIGAQLRALPCVRAARGDVETVVLFHVDDAAPVFAVLRACKRRRLSATARAQLQRAGAGTRFEGVHCGAGDDFPAARSSRKAQSAPDKGPAAATTQRPRKRSPGAPQPGTWGPPQGTDPGGLVQGAPFSTIDAQTPAGDWPAPLPSSSAVLPAG